MTDFNSISTHLVLWLELMELHSLYFYIFCVTVSEIFAQLYDIKYSYQIILRKQL